MRQAAVVLMALGLAGYGDPNPDPVRGYVKPPLERPGLIVDGEEPGEVSGLGAPIRPRPRDPAQVLPPADGT